MPSITASNTDHKGEVSKTHGMMSRHTCEYRQTDDVAGTLPPDPGHAGQRNHTGKGDPHADIQDPGVIKHPVLDVLNKHDDSHDSPSDHQLTHQNPVDFLQKSPANVLKRQMRFTQRQV